MTILHLKFQVSQMETVLASQTNELDALKAKLKGLEDQLAHKENVIEEQKRLLEEAREASSDNKMEFESLYKVTHSNEFQQTPLFVLHKCLLEN